MTLPSAPTLSPPSPQAASTQLLPRAQELFAALAQGWQALDCINLAAALHHLASLAEAVPRGAAAFCRCQLFGDPRWAWLLDQVAAAAATPGFGPQCVANSLAALCRLDALSPQLLHALQAPLLRALAAPEAADCLTTRGLTQVRDACLQCNPLWQLHVTPWLHVDSLLHVQLAEPSTLPEHSCSSAPILHQRPPLQVLHSITSDLPSLKPLILHDGMRARLWETLWAAAPSLDAQVGTAAASIGWDGELPSLLLCLALWPAGLAVPQSICCH